MAIRQLALPLLAPRNEAISVKKGPFEPRSNHPDGLASALQSPDVYPIFWGSYWLSHMAAVKTLAQDLADVTTENSNAYLSGISQYHTTGVAIFNADDGPFGAARWRTY